MIRLRTAVGFSLLCACVFCAFAAPSASAKGTTAFTCVKGGGALDFTDAHCDNEVTPGSGSFGHVSLGTEPKVIEVTNAGTKSATTESTPLVLNATITGAPIEISCAKVNGSATITNKEIGGVMQNEGREISMNISECVFLKPAQCSLKAGELKLATKVTSLTVENIKGTEMGVKFEPEKFAGVLFEAEIEGAECPFKGKVAQVVGSTTATGPRPSTEVTASRGATMVVTKEMTAETLKVAGASASISSTLTVKTSTAPVTLTTTTP
jgi:hypothetical protein